MYISVKGIDFASVSTIFLLDFDTVLTVWYFDTVLTVWYFRHIHDHSPTIPLTDIYMTTHQQYPKQTYT
jgi:hypothetical protein